MERKIPRKFIIRHQKKHINIDCQDNTWNAKDNNFSEAKFEQKLRF